MLDWIAGWILIYAVLFGIGSVVLASFATAIACFAVATAATILIARDLARRGWKNIAE